MPSNFIQFLKDIGTKWQKTWSENHVYEPEPVKGKESYFATFPYPYVNGSVHLGHGYTIMKVDAMVRYMRMKGYVSWFPQGFHATGEPIVGQAKRVKQRNKIALFTLKKFGVKDEDIPKFEDPHYMVKYFITLMKKDLQSVGLSIDWRAQFVTTDLTPEYSKFITWQYLRLREKGYVVKGTHPVIYCPSCKSPTGDHDRLEGEGVSIAEMHVILFGPDKNGYYYPSATLRPETIFGVTNVFLKPGEEYVIAEYDGKKLLMSERALFKLKDQLYDMKEIGKVRADDLFGQTVPVPVTGQEVPILPGAFIDMDYGTAVVMSVPAHAPFDWAAIKSLGKVDGNQVKIDSFTLEPKPIIETPGFPLLSAVELVNKQGLTVNDEEGLEALTKQVYKKELNKGKMVKDLPVIGGMPVNKAREKIIEYLNEQGLLMKMYEPEGLVVCRCGTKNHVKVLKEQWFLKYSDENWKQLAREAVSRMQFYPPEARNAFEGAVEWVSDKACARKSGLGTKLPWDPEWIVETLSDSTIYMAYYPIQKYVNAGKISAKNMIPEFFDYVFTGKGDLKELAKATGLTQKLLKQIRNEFDFWYPMNLRRSGKDLISNHLTFSIFHHVALFPKDKWPLAFSVNGMMKIEGKKMSKSKGVLTPLSEAVDMFGADLVRTGLLAAGEGLGDANFRENDILSFQSRLEKIYELVKSLKEMDEQEKPIDAWLITKWQETLERVNHAFENIMTRTATNELLHAALNDLRWYERRRGSFGPAAKQVITELIIALTPITPHFSEEMWHLMGNKGYVVDQPYPVKRENLMNQQILAVENYLQSVYEDVNEILKVMGKHNPKELHIIVAPEWSYEVQQLIHEHGGKAMGIIAKDPKFKPVQKRAMQLAKQFMKAKGTKIDFTANDELQALNDFKPLLEETYGFKVFIHKAEETELEKKNLAVPMKPGIQFK